MDWEEFRNLDLAEIGQWPRPAKLLVWGFMLFFIAYMTHQLLIQDRLTALGQAEREERMLKLQFENKYRMAVHLAAQQRGETPPSGGAGNNSVATLLEQISQAGARNGLEFLLFQPEPEIKTMHYTELPIRIRVAGSYHRFGHFINELAGLSQTFSLQELRISRTNHVASAGVADAQPLIMELVAKRYRLQTPDSKVAKGG